MTDTLFDPAPFLVAPPEPAPKLKPGARRTQRQAQAINSGLHPLTAALRYPIRLHPDAPRDRDTPGPRCGTCWYRELTYTNGNRQWPKCMYGVENDTDQHRAGPPPRVTSGPGTDVRAWWPACVDYSPGDPRLSADAARCVPEVP